MAGGVFVSQLSHLTRRPEMHVTIGIGLLGCGTVGSAVAERLVLTDVRRRYGGVACELRAIAVADPSKARPSALNRDLFTTDARAVVDDPNVDVVIECIGGTTDAADLVERALARGRHVITANKDLIGTQGPRLRALAAAFSTQLRYEAAVGGGIPVVRTIVDALAGDRIDAIAGVLNGTSTAILSSMERGVSFAAALADAQRAGFAEADPASDVEGIDAAHKLAIVMQDAFDLAIVSPRIRRRGITTVTARDVAIASERGLRIRLVAAAMRKGDHLAAEVAPVCVPVDHEFARTAGAENVVAIRTGDAGQLVLRGLGAGGPATASAILGDLHSTMRAFGRANTATTAGVRSSPALDVAPFFPALDRARGLPDYPLWDDRCLTGAPAAQRTFAISWPGKGADS
jgi:homoserine dehydrogenase